MDGEPKAFHNFFDYIRCSRAYVLENEIYILIDKAKGVELAFIKTNYLSFYLLKPWSEDRLKQMVAFDGFNGKVLKESYLAL